LSGSLTDMPHDLFNSQPAQSTVASEEETTVENVERAHILRILEQRHWRIEGPHGAAVVLGLKPSTLRSRMRRLRIDRLFQADKYH
jgi:formate hydrogenlyase transcriptional activator